MNRFIKMGLTTPPCGVPRSRGMRAPSCVANGATNHRSMYKRIQSSLMWARTAFISSPVIDLIEGRLDIKLHDPVVSPAAFTSDRHGLLRRASRPIPIGVGMEDRVELWLDEKLDDGLRNTVTDRGHSQLARASRCLGNLYLLHRRREVRSRRHPVPQLVKILRPVLLELGDGLIVDA